MQNVLNEFGYRAGLEISEALAAQAGSAVSDGSLQRIEQKLDAALNGAASSVPTPATRATAMTTIVARAQAQLAGRKQRQGMDKKTGRVLSGSDHLQQSIADILLTPVGSRVMRRTYGSRLRELISQPYTNTTVLQVYAAVADALRQWEPRFALKKIQAQWSDINQQASDRKNGVLNLVLGGDYLGSSISVEVAV